MTGSTHNAAAQEPGLLGIAVALARRRLLMFGVPAGVAILVAVLNLTARPIYTGTASILPPQYNQSTVSSMQTQFGGESLIGNSMLTLKNPTDLVVGILFSRTIRDAVATRENLGAHYGLAAADDIRRKLDAATDIRAGKDGIVVISAEDHDPRKAAAIANAYIDEFHALSRTLSKQEARRRAEFYDNALDAARTRLREADLALRDVESTTGYSRLRGTDEAIVLAAAELQAQIDARDVQLRTMQAYATDANPDVRLIRRELESLRKQLGALEQRHPDAKPGTPGRSSPFVAVGGVPDALQAHTVRRREVTYWETMVLVLGKYRELGMLDETRDLSLFQVLDRAVPPSKKSKPRTTVNVLVAGVGSGFLCLQLALGAELVARRRRDSAAFEAGWKALVEAWVPLWLRRLVQRDRR